MILEIIRHDPNNEFAMAEIVRMGQIIDTHEQTIRDMMATLKIVTYMES